MSNSPVMDRPALGTRDALLRHVSSFLFTCYRGRPGFSGTGREDDSVVLYVDKAVVDEYWPEEHMGVQITLRPVPSVWCPGHVVG